MVMWPQKWDVEDRRLQTGRAYTHKNTQEENYKEVHFGSKWRIF